LAGFFAAGFFTAMNSPKVFVVLIAECARRILFFVPARHAFRMVSAQILCISENGDACPVSFRYLNAMSSEWSSTRLASSAG
jgi:hypothetical protein